MKMTLKRSLTSNSSKSTQYTLPRCRWDGSLWNLWNDGVSQSFIRSFRKCREQTRLKFVEGWTSRETAFYHEFGSMTHWVFSKIYEKKKPPTKSQVLTLLQKYKNFWYHNVPKPTTKQREQLQTCADIASVVIPAYVTRWASDWSATKKRSPIVQPHTWVGLEHQFKVPYKYPDGCTTFLRGMFDGVFYDKRTNMYLFETKCLSMISEDNLTDTLPMDIQVMLYLHVLQIKFGKRPSGVLYNVVRRPGHRLGKTETPKDFYERMEADVTSPKRQDHFFMRWQVDITDAEMKYWEKNVLDPTMQDIRDWYTGKAAHYLNEEALITKYGRSDMYEAIVRKNFRNMYKRKVAFGELQELEAA